MSITVKTGKTTYDLICPSEYTIQKMIRLNMLDEYDFEYFKEHAEQMIRDLARTERL